MLVFENAQGRNFFGEPFYVSPDILVSNTNINQNTALYCSHGHSGYFDPGILNTLNDSTHMFYFSKG
jgi:hypothetical protein